MSVEVMQTVSLVMYILAGVALAAGIAMFFLLNIPKIFNDITGATARKAIANIRQQNEESGDKAYRPSRVNIARGKITDRMTSSGSLKPAKVSMGVSMETEKFSTDKLAGHAEETTVLSENEAGGAFSVDVDMEYTASSEIIE